MTNKILKEKIYETRNNETISDNQEKCYASIDNIPEDILDEYIFDFLKDIEFDEFCLAEIVADMDYMDIETFLCFYYLVMTVPEKEFLGFAEAFYNHYILFVMNIVSSLYYTKEFFMLANILSINTSDIVQMHKLQNKVVDYIWYELMSVLQYLVDNFEQYFEVETIISPDYESENPHQEHRFFTISHHFHAEEYEANFNNCEIEDVF